MSVNRAYLFRLLSRAALKVQNEGQRDRNRKTEAGRLRNYLAPSRDF